MLCRHCGSDVPVGAKFCANCGASQVATAVERRVVSVLFADIVGFTSLAEQLDPEAAKLLIDSCFEQLIADITGFGGVIDKIMGDGIIALFGAPVAHEDDAERAVRAALRMQQSMMEMGADTSHRLRLRVGINTGEVLVGASRAGGDYTAMGDVMNTASRLEGQAQPGQVLVGRATYDATAEAIDYERAGDLVVKGKQQTVEAFIAVRAKYPPGSRRRVATSFVGRDAELELLSAQARLAVELRRSQFAMIEGDAGMGKTSLVLAAADTIRERFGGRVLQGYCIPYGEANVWWPIADLLRRQWGLDADAAPEEARSVVESYVRRLTDVRAEGDSDERELLVSSYLHLMGYDTALRGGEREQNRNAVVRATSMALQHLLVEGPVVLILSDVHWASEAVRFLIGAVLNELDHEQLIMLVTARSGEAPSIETGHAGLTHLRLDPLSDEASQTLLDRLGVDLPEAALESLIDRAGGNPFFIEELARLVKEADASDGADIIEATPSTLRGMVAARLDQLTTSERELVDDAAVIGRTGSLAALSSMAQEARGVADIGPDLAGLTRAGLLEVSGSRYNFASDLVREVAYSTITKSDRVRAHAGIASYLERHFHPGDRSALAVAIASHYRAAALLSRDVDSDGRGNSEHLKDRALRWLSLAGEIALTAGELSEARRIFDEAMALGPCDNTRPRLLYGRARALAELYEIELALADLAAYDTLGFSDAALDARVLAVRGDVERRQGSYSAASGTLRSAANRLGELGLLSDQALALRQLGRSEMAAGNGQAALDAFFASRGVAQEAGDARAEAWAVQSLAVYAFSTGRIQQAAALVDAAFETFKRVNDQTGMAWASGLEAWVLYHSGDWREAKSKVEAVLPIARRGGDPWAKGLMYSLAASLELWSGNARQSLKLARDTQRAARRTNDQRLVAESMILEGRALVSLGRIGDGTRRLEEASRFAVATNDRSAVRLACVANAASAARLGDYERAIAWAQNYAGGSLDLSMVGESDLVVSLALALLQRGDTAGAQETLAQVEHGAEQHHYGQAVHVWLHAALHRSDAVEERSARLVGVGTYLDEVFSLWALALDRARGGRRDRARQALDRASSLLSATDDRLSPALHRFVTILCREPDSEQQVDLDAAAASARVLGFEPAGWYGLFVRVLGDDPLAQSSSD